MKNRDEIIKRLETLIEELNTTPQIDLTLENIVAELKDIKEEIGNNF